MTMAGTNRRKLAVVASALAAVIVAAVVATSFTNPTKAIGSTAVGSASSPGTASSATATTTTIRTPVPPAAKGPTSQGPSSAGPTSKAPASTGSKRAQPMKFGVDYSDTLTFDTRAQLSAALDDAKQLGAGYIRVDFGWEDFQSFADYAPDFSRFDPVVAAANARGLKIMATLDFPPPWARQASCVSTAACPPASDAAYAAFAKEAVSRYAPQGVHLWEIWNEPNIEAWAPTPNAAAYTKLLIAASTAIRAADTQAYVLLGGMAAGHPSPGAPFISPYDFITAVAAGGGMKAVDAVAYHPYPDGTPAGSATFQAIDASPDNIVAALTRAGYPNMPIWINETGALVPDAQGTAAQYQPEEAAQAQAARQEAAYLDAIPQVAAMFWFSDQDVPSDGLYFGLRTVDGRRRPAFAAFQQAIAAAGKDS